MPTAIASLPVLKMCKVAGCDKIATGYKGTCFNHSVRKGLGGYRSSPRATAKHSVGVEIECFNPDTIYKVTHVAPHVCRDGSIGHGGEIKLCASEDKIENKASDTVQRSALVGNKVDKRCGLHLHFSMPQNANGYNYDVRQRVTSLTMAMQDFMFDIVPRSRKQNGYCGRIASINNVNSHYSWFSLSDHHPTYEIRIHAGTMNPWKIKGWINAWIQVRPDIHKVINGDEGWEDIVTSFNKDGFLTKLDTSSIGYKYVKARSLGSGTLTRFGF